MISIVDDDRSVREAVRSLIRSLGHQAETFSSAEEFLSSDRMNDSKCVITDLQMTGMTGTDLQRHLLEVGYGRPIILMSARSTEEIGAAAKGSAFCRFLRKPFSDDRLVECLDWALNGDHMKSPPTQPICLLGSAAWPAPNARGVGAATALAAARVSGGHPLVTHVNVVPALDDHRRLQKFG
jgi:DNA-binding NtrC family response regulator